MNSTTIDYSVSGPNEQQIIHRYNDSSGRLHYLFLNGEHGTAISRGEGHEQPDQLQLLYYIDNTSYLMDTGYDAANFIEGIPPDWEASSWNKWELHNVMISDNYKLNLSP
ncbi:MAG: hypothetical protein MK198_15030 [Gracilimonas sp.]|uniref:hypothetical protein n=1 Tax=Gracilimonas sp. TaxID=1974203 RepID=UPI0037533570|nr:hypothetical protein [Gracilimonas sp.]